MNSYFKFENIFYICNMDFKLKVVKKIFNLIYVENEYQMNKLVQKRDAKIYAIKATDAKIMEEAQKRDE